MHDFKFHRPSSLRQAQQVLRDTPDGKLLAGGQSLLPVLKLRLAEPSDLISISGLGELSGIRREADAIVIGAGTTHADVAASREVRSTLPALAALAGMIGDPQVRHRGTLGGSVAHADPAADYPAAVLALDATIVTDRRQIAADDFFKSGMFETALERDEIITALRFPIVQKAAYAKFPNPASKYAVVGVMVASGARGVRVAVTGAGPSVFRFVDAEKALAQRFSVGALDAASYPSDDLLSDLHASPDYRAHLVPVMTRRAVALASQ
jgi:carbon-monoxide dehydrogenase medium subunit